jgi:hypothetical protein
MPRTALALDRLAQSPEAEMPAIGTENGIKVFTKTATA